MKILKPLLLILFFIISINSFSQKNEKNKATNTWDGSEDIKWDESGNWSLGTIPSSVTDVIIPTTPSGNSDNFPERIGTNAVCNDLTIQAGAKLTVRSTDSLHVYGNLLLETPNNSGSAGSLKESGQLAVDGTVTFKRYYNVSGRWQYICSPLNNSNSDLFTKNTSSGNFNPNFLKFNEAYDCDPNPDGTYADWTNTDLVESWENHHNGESGAAENLGTGIGYATYNEGNITVTYSGSTHSVINNQDINIPVTLNSNDGNSGYYDGWNLVGNPYTSAIRWGRRSAEDPDVIQNTAYCWDSDASNYKYINGNGGDESGDGSNVLNGSTEYIAAGQGFFVKATTTGNFIMKSSLRSHALQDLWKTKNFQDKTFSNNSVEPVIQYIKLRIEDNNYSDETVIRFTEDATYEFDDDYDAYKLASSNEDVPLIYSLSADKNTIMAINSLPFHENDIYRIPLCLKTKEAKQYTIILKESEYSDLDIFLKDNYENKLIDLKKFNQYSFDFAGGSDNNRFAIYYRTNSSGVNQDFINKTMIYPNPSNGKFFVETTNQAVSVKIISITGEEVKYIDIPLMKTELNLSEFAKGIYFITVNYKTESVTKKIIIQ